MKLSNVLSVFILFAAVVFSPFEAHAAELYAILVGDTTDIALGTAMEQNLIAMQQHVTKIASSTGRHLTLTIIKGHEAQTGNVLKEVQNLKISSDDVVILYFSCHGYRPYDKLDPWPDLLFTLEGAGIEMNYLNHIIMEQNPRFLLSIADSCNSYVNGHIPTLRQRTAKTLTPQKVPRIDPKVERRVYQQLFNESSGVILMSGSHPGQVSWGIEGAGSFLTMSFLTALEEVISARNANVRWEDLLTITDRRVNELVTYFRSRESKPMEQTPQFQIMLRAE